MFLNLAKNSVLVFKHRFRTEYAVKHFLFFFWPAHNDSVQPPGKRGVGLTHYLWLPPIEVDPRPGSDRTQPRGRAFGFWRRGFFRIFPYSLGGKNS
ncbi:MAG: hypothetical protein C5B58_16110 [Acidobacteria bacterium]|nr:MAG: hypothetical protein C5B58_16110 [Acidobacteriota bacterium]